MAALFLSIGLQWACLQSAAWVGMAVSYSQQASFSEALVMTFDGKHPCRICKAVGQREKNPQHGSLKIEVKKIDLVAQKQDVFVPDVFVHDLVVRVNELQGEWPMSPLTTPPERVA